MYEFKYFLAKCQYLLKGRNKEIMNEYFRNMGMNIGKSSNICSNIMTPEPYLITIGENVTISNDVQFITHDNSVSKILPEMTDLFGKIVIGDNCFIGQRAIIMYGVVLASNIIVASGSVVAKSFNESNIIIAGNPARKIGNWEQYKIKRAQCALNIAGLNVSEKKKLILNNRCLVEK